jgi:hypothetical protein
MPDILPMHLVETAMTLNASVFGTAFLVDGTWYARCEGGGGTLVPIEAAKEIREMLTSGQAYSFEGRRMSDHRGYPNGLHVVGAKPIGAPVQS